MGSNFEKPGFDLLRCQDLKKVMKTKRVTSHQRQNKENNLNVVNSGPAPISCCTCLKTPQQYTCMLL